MRRYKILLKIETMSNLQLELLRLYGNGVSDESLCEIKAILAKYFADIATDAMDKVWEEKLDRRGYDSPDE